jgi:hypothetical protein
MHDPTALVWICAVQHIDRRLGVEVVYRDYGTSCTLMDPHTGKINWTGTHLLPLVLRVQ